MNRTPALLASSLALGTLASLAVPASGQGVQQENAAAVAATARSAFEQAFTSDEVVQADPRHFDAMHWTNAQAQELLGVIRAIGAEGLVPADYLPDDLAAALRANDAQQIDELASTAFAWLVEDLRDGRTPMANRRQWFVVDPDADRSPTATVMASALESGDIAGALDALKPTHPDYAALRDKLAQTPANATQQRRLIRANMDRWRWLARDLGPQYLITNVPEYQLRLTVNNQIIRTYRTVVGKPGRTATPQLAETVSGVVFNPTWTVPQSIVRGEGLGERVLNNPSWAARQGYRATRGANGYITVVQQPGPGNALGVMKLDMPNPHAIFFHDTPSRQMFNQDDRALSHGCIRTERALELAMTIAILGQGATRDEVVGISTSGEYTRVPVKKTMPAYITYFTYGVDIDGNLREFDDIYSRDAPVFASLDAPRVRDRARVSSEEVIEVVDDPRDTL
ncbi:L,D-transpeptidase [Aurantiacibacter xanthus]|uniref:L,D-transpeptidase n=1 Tax=Aurantiacibacter xanthus TaxID=1784712 RepID=A0A3A1P8K2_9SPHN|nr:L,D-transpeptidase family protein [Aurantiacibacter xanthus]RIV86273.1 L,D-transpeptidase [Aurantiacibacter xanthus]